MASVGAAVNAAAMPQRRKAGRVPTPDSSAVPSAGAEHDAPPAQLPSGARTNRTAPPFSWVRRSRAAPCAEDVNSPVNASDRAASIDAKSSSADGVSTTGTTPAAIGPGAPVIRGIVRVAGVQTRYSCASSVVSPCVSTCC
ncbi:MAG: hypothetical protein QOF44_2718 [Streptomyces sp.]|nr:hypothetical protein [Streptomyces sp.]